MADSLMDLIKPQLDGLREMYRAGYHAGIQEGRRQANLDYIQDLKKLQEGVFHDETTAAQQDGVRESDDVRLDAGNH